MKKKLVALWRNKRKSEMFLIITFAVTIVFPIILIGFIFASISVELYAYAFMTFMSYLAIIVIGKQYLDIAANQKEGKRY